MKQRHKLKPNWNCIKEYKVYWKEEDIAAEEGSDYENDKEEAEEYINDTLLHETIDGHQWVIYYAYNLDIIKYSGNAEYAVDNLGAEAAAEAGK